MSLRRDGALAGVVFVGTAVAVLVAGVSLSPRWLVAGGLGTVGFEVLAMRNSAAVRRRWERPGVQAASVGTALVVVVLGTRFAPAVVLSAVLGALAAYLLVLGCVVGYRHLDNG